MANEKNTSTGIDFEAEIAKTARGLASAREAIEALQFSVQSIDRQLDTHEHQIKRLDEKVAQLEETGPQLDSKSLATYLGTLAGGTALFVVALAAAGGIGSRVREALVSKDQLEHERALERLAYTPSPLIVSGGTTVPTGSPSAEFVRGSFVT